VTFVAGFAFQFNFSSSLCSTRRMCHLVSCIVPTVASLAKQGSRARKGTREMDDVRWNVQCAQESDWRDLSFLKETIGTITI
jgi:hypothetical protein